jgi:FkbM family methyltransferase
MLISTPDIVAILQKYNIKINGALHIGAHECEELSFYSKLGLDPQQVIWIDALEKKVQECKSKNIPNVFHSVISDNPDKIITFNETNNGRTHLTEHPHIYVTQTHSMKTTTVDNFMHKNNFNPQSYNFWNLDIQGAEYKALLGGLNSLLFADVLYLEINEAELYKNCMLLPELDSFLNMRGFGRILTNMTQHHWGDAMYIKKHFIHDYNYIQSKLPVVSVNIIGGLGNQLFQIASAYSYARKEQYDLQIIKKTSNGNRPLYWDTVLKKTQPFLVNKLSSQAELLQFNEKNATQYTPIPSIKNSGTGIYLTGYLQSSKYFYNDTIKNEIKQLFLPSPKLLREVCDKYNTLIQNKDNVIVIHARRTDYITHSAFHGPLDIQYYKIAIEKMLTRVNNPVFLFSSDDNSFWNELARDIPQLQQCQSFVLEDSDINTFVLLQQFKYYIMSNSTFCWWSVYLSNPKHVIVPSKWFGPQGIKEYQDIYENTWEKI